MLSLVAALALAFQPGSPDPVEDAPTGPAPTIQIVRADGKGNLVTQSTHMVPVTLKQQVERVVAGKVVVETVTVTQMRAETLASVRPLKGLTFTDLAGKKLDEGEVARQIAKPTPVVVVQTGKALHPAYQRLFARGTLVLALPGHGVMAPAPLAPPLPAPRLPPSR